MVKTPDDIRKEVRNLTHLGLVAKLEKSLMDMDYLINATPSGERRNTLCDCNIQLIQLVQTLQSMRPE